MRKYNCASRVEHWTSWLWSCTDGRRAVDIDDEVGDVMCDDVDVVDVVDETELDREGE